MSFFVAGGTVPPGSASYVERSADRELFEALVAGEFCYVLNSRQMGKSSLAVRTVARLANAGIRTGFVDLTRVGGATVSGDQWYSGLLLEAGRSLGLRTEAASWIKEHRDVGAAQRLFSFLHEVALAQDDRPIVLMFDEIDAVRSLGFSTDELFAGIRQLHNGRASDPSLRRITICLLGAALPSDLIRDPRSTPFNVGIRIELRDLTNEEAKPFAHALGGQRKLDRLLYWTGGHPFLTQALGAEVALGQQNVDTLVQERYLEARARETDTNLSDVGRRLLGEGDPNVGDKERADTLSLYAKLLKGGIPDDESNAATARIKMSGVARLENGRLTIRNRIYGQVFDSGWIRNNMPGQELRRQKRAFLKGALRTAVVALAVISTVSYLAWRNYDLAQREAKARQSTEYELYAAQMMLVGDAYGRHDLDLVQRILGETRSSPYRGLEWDLWQSVAAQSLRFSADENQWCNFPGLSFDGKTIAAEVKDGINLLDASTGQLKLKVGSLHLPGVRWLSNEVVLGQDAEKLTVYRAHDGHPLWSRSSKTIQNIERPICPTSRGTFYLQLLENGKPFLRECEILTGKPTQTRPIPIPINASTYCVGDREVLVINDNGRFNIGKLIDVDTGKVRLLPSLGSSYVGVSRDRRTLALIRPDRTVEIRDTATLKILGRAKLAPDSVNNICLSEDGRLLGIVYRNLHADVLDVQSGKEIAGYQGTNSIVISSRTNTVLTAYRAVRVYNLDNKLSGRIELPFRGWKGIRSLDGKAFTVWGVSSLLNSEVGKTDTGKIVDFPDSTRLWDCPYPGKQPIQMESNAVNIRDTDGKERRIPLPFVGFDGTMSADGHLLAALDSSGARVALIDLAKPSAYKMIALNKIATNLAFDRKGERLSVGCSSGDIDIIRVSDGEIEQQLSGHDYGVIRSRFSSSGNELLSFGDDDKAVLWDLRTGKGIPLEGHSYTVQGGDISPDGRRVVTASYDCSVMIWDAATGRHLSRIPFPANQPIDARFIDNGRSLAVLAKYDLHIWSCVPRDGR